MRRSRLLLLGATLVAGLVTVPVVALPVAPAHAVAPTVVESEPSPTNLDGVKEITVECPGSFVYGAGGFITGGGTGRVAIQAVVPEGSPPTRVRVTAAALGLVSSAWNVSAWATCGPLTTGLQVVPESLTESLTQTKEVSPSCPTGMGLYGTGFRITQGNGNVLIHDVIPGTSVSPKGVTVRATMRPNSGVFWGLTGYAICANRASTMRIEQATTTATSNPTRNIDRICSDSATFAHGVGVQTFSAGDEVDGRITLSGMAALNNRSGFAAAGENGTVNENWQLRVYVICSN